MEQRSTTSSVPDWETTRAHTGGVRWLDETRPCPAWAGAWSSLEAHLFWRGFWRMDKRERDREARLASVCDDGERDKADVLFSHLMSVAVTEGVTSAVDDPA